MTGLARATPGPLLVTAALLALGCLGPGGGYEVAAEGCRGGRAQGAYRLVGSAGDRVEGTFCEGRRCGAFTYYAAPELRVAELPYREGALHGRVRLWYMPESAPGSADRRKLHAAFAEGRRHGESRSWWADGRPRAVYRYEEGELVAARAWHARGARLSEERARARAREDAASDRRYLERLESLVDAHRPRCPAEAR